MLLLLSEKGNKYLIKKEGTYVFEEGKVVISKEDIKNIPKEITTSTNRKMLLLEPTYEDLFLLAFKRGAQIIHEKDLGYILRHFYLNKEMKVLEAGTGSGHATIYLSLISKEVVAYEKDKRFYNLTKRNLETFGVKNVSLNFGDVKEISCKNKEKFDLVVFDFKESSKEIYVEKAKECLKPGGFLVLYLPVMEQVFEAVNNLKKKEFVDINVNEILLREWKTNPLRPKTMMIGHTAFIVSGRKFNI